MTTRVYPASSRGSANFDWLKTNYSFSFAYYRNPERMGFGPLRVLNDDWIAPASGFPPHSHANMEIITLPFTGTLSHKDSSGGEGSIQAGEVQMMSAGTGITHSEYNNDPAIPVELFQIWIEPNQMNVAPRYEERNFDFGTIKNSIKPFITPTGADGTFQIYQNAYFSWVQVEQGTELTYKLHGSGQGVFAIVIEGSASIADQKLNRRDAIEIEDSTSVHISSNSEATVLLIEVPLV